MGHSPIAIVIVIQLGRHLCHWLDPYWIRPSYSCHCQKSQGFLPGLVHVFFLKKKCLLLWSPRILRSVLIPKKALLLGKEFLLFPGEICHKHRDWGWVFCHPCWWYFGDLLVAAHVRLGFSGAAPCGRPRRIWAASFHGGKDWNHGVLNLWYVRVSWIPPSIV